MNKKIFFYCLMSLAFVSCSVLGRHPTSTPLPPTPTPLPPTLTPLPPTATPRPTTPAPIFLSIPLDVFKDKSGRLYLTTAYNELYQMADMDCRNWKVYRQINNTWLGGIYVDAGGKIYGGDMGGNRIIRMDDMNGNGWSTYGGQGDGIGQFWEPKHVTFDTSGRIYISDAGNNRIVRIDDFTGTHWTEYGTKGAGKGQFQRPNGIAFDATGRIYIADASNHRIVRMDDMNGTNWIAYGDRGSGIGQFMNVDLSLEPNDEGPEDLALDAQGRIYVADSGNNRIVRFDDMNGTSWTTFGTYGGGQGEMEVPEGIFVDDEGRIYFADGLNSRVVRMDDINGSGWVTCP